MIGPVVLTLMDVVMIVGIVIGSIGLLALVAYKHFRVAGKLTLAVLAAIAVNVSAHALHLLLRL